MTTECYPATVMAIDTDAEDGMRGRIKVACVGLLGDEETALPMWVEPIHNWGWFTMPDVGETVEIEVTTSGDDDEQFGQSSIDNLNIKWRGHRFHTDPTFEDSQNTPSPIHQDFTAENYGKRRGFATPFGHVLMFDDTEATPRIYLTMMTAPLDPPDGAPDETQFTRLEFEPDGSFNITTLANSKIRLDAVNKALMIELDDQQYTLKLDSAAMELKLNGATLKLEGADADAIMTVGDGTKHVAIVEALQELWTQTKTKVDLHDQHIHPTSMGPSGPPNPLIQMPDWNSAINSTKIKIPDA
jgi:hypothetical protein